MKRLRRQAALHHVNGSLSIGAGNVSGGAAFPAAAFFSPAADGEHPARQHLNMDALADICRIDATSQLPQQQQQHSEWPAADNEAIRPIQQLLAAGNADTSTPLPYWLLPAASITADASAVVHQQPAVAYGADVPQPVQPAAASNAEPSSLLPVSPLPAPCGTDASELPPPLQQSALGEAHFPSVLPAVHSPAGGDADWLSALAMLARGSAEAATSEEPAADALDEAAPPAAYIADGHAARTAAAIRCRGRSAVQSVVGTPPPSRKRRGERDSNDRMPPAPQKQRRIVYTPATWQPATASQQHSGDGTNWLPPAAQQHGGSNGLGGQPSAKPQQPSPEEPQGSGDSGSESLVSETGSVVSGGGGSACQPKVPSEETRYRGVHRRVWGAFSAEIDDPVSVRHHLFRLSSPVQRFAIRLYTSFSGVTCQVGELHYAGSIGGIHRTMERSMGGRWE